MQAWWGAMPEVTVRLFGAFRSFGLGNALTVSLPEGVNDVAALRAALVLQMPDDAARSWLASSAFATDSRVLQEGEALPVGAALSILPPVCGG
jgi:molybdopterin converting factor small subunit